MWPHFASDTSTCLGPTDSLLLKILRLNLFLAPDLSSYHVQNEAKSTHNLVEMPILTSSLIPLLSNSLVSLMCSVIMEWRQGDCSIMSATYLLGKLDRCLHRRRKTYKQSSFALKASCDFWTESDYWAGYVKLQLLP